MSVFVKFGCSQNRGRGRGGYRGGNRGGNRGLLNLGGPGVIGCTMTE